MIVMDNESCICRLNKQAADIFSADIRWGMTAYTASFPSIFIYFPGYTRRELNASVDGR